MNEKQANKQTSEQREAEAWMNKRQAGATDVVVDVAATAAVAVPVAVNASRAA